MSTPFMPQVDRSSDRHALVVYLVAHVRPSGLTTSHRKPRICVPNIEGASLGNSREMADTPRKKFNRLSKNAIILVVSTKP